MFLLAPRPREAPYFQNGEEIFAFFSPVPWYKASRGRGALIRRKHEEKHGL